MIAEKMQTAISEQIGEELASAYLYLSMAGYFESLSLAGMAHWMKMQAVEEMLHAMRFFDHVTGRSGRVSLPAVGQPQRDWDSPLAAFQDAYKHEQYITGRIDALVDLAVAGRDHAAQAMLQWFVTEQIEEEASTSRIADALKRVGGAGEGLLMLDRELALRPMPALTTTPAA